MRLTTGKYGIGGLLYFGPFFAYVTISKREEVLALSNDGDGAKIMTPQSNNAFSFEADAGTLKGRASGYKVRSLLQSETAIFSQVDEAVRAAADLDRKQIQILVIVN